ncbi:MAG: hypothetical protein WD750_07860, partial [Gammaproteobacteria bacterium]
TYIRQAQDRNQGRSTKIRGFTPLLFPGNAPFTTFLPIHNIYIENSHLKSLSISLFMVLQVLME